MAHSISKLAATSAIAITTSPAVAIAATSAATTTKDDALLMLLAVAIVLAVYFLPTIIAAKRGIGYVQALCIANALTGWTIVGWIICLIWSLTRASVRPLPQPILVRDNRGGWHVRHLTVARAHHH